MTFQNDTSYHPVNMKDRVVIQDALKHLFDCEYNNRTAGAESLAGALALPLEQAGRLSATLQTAGLVSLRDGSLKLSKRGRKYALQVIRAHRLYETYLARETGLSESSWHREAEVREHKLSDPEVDSLAERLGHPRFDPHGAPIPTKNGYLPAPRGKSLLECPIGWEGRVVHIEDEPDAAYAGIIANGIFPGMRISMVEIEPAFLRVNVEGRTIELSRSLAANIFAAELEKGELPGTPVRRLTDLKDGENGEVVGLSPACRGAERMRLLDLGLVPGSKIGIDLKSPFNGPIAYRIRGSMIALRKEQAEQIFIKETQENKHG